MKDIAKITLTMFLTLALIVVEWKMWWFFRHEFRNYNPSDEMMAAGFIAWAIVAIAMVGIVAAAVAKIYEPRGKSTDI